MSKRGARNTDRGRPGLLGFTLLAASIALLVQAAPTRAQERPGTLSLGIQGQYGIIAGPSDFAEDYDRGDGFAIRIRYALGGPQAFGISFESQTFDPDFSGVRENEPEDLKFANAMVEYLRYFNRGQGRSQYAVIGAGLFHPSEVLASGVSSPSDGLVITGGGGMEIFIRRTTAIDLSLRAYGLIGDSVSATLQAAVGFHFYLIK
jgi:hypothetical protein